MLYAVTINFKSGPAFGVTVQAADKRTAEADAMSRARENGFDGAAKSVKSMAQ